MYVWISLQVDFGVLAACFHAEEGNTSYCIIQQYELMDTFGVQLYNEFECPLLSLTNFFHCVSSNSISQSVSVTHQCTSSCTQIERQTVTAQKFTFVHDFCNNLYSFNVYCMH